MPTANPSQRPQSLSHDQPADHSACLGPLPIIDTPNFAIPNGACDTHAHVIGDNSLYPYVANRSYTPPPASEENYLSMLSSCGMQRGVLVQVSIHGTDNRYMLEVLKRHPKQLRGVAVVNSDITDAELEALHAAGVRGVRLNVLFGGGVGFDALETLATRIAGLGWHMQFLMDVRDLPALMPRMRKLAVPCVFDHMGHTPVSEGITQAGFQALLHGVKDYGWWCKLSGAYRISEQFNDYRDVTQSAQALIDAAPDRMLWGSDWPHVAIKQMPNTGLMLNLLEKWAPEPAQRQRILVDNPQLLYDFPSVS